MQRNTAMYAVLFVTGLLWIQSGFAKLLSRDFPQQLHQTLTVFASKNPYIWYRHLLINQALPMSLPIGYVVESVELLVGLILVVAMAMAYFRPLSRVAAAFVGLALICSIVLNSLFWLASAWTSPSTNSLNLLLIAIGVIGLFTMLPALKKSVL